MAFCRARCAHAAAAGARSMAAASVASEKPVAEIEKLAGSMPKYVTTGRVMA